MAGENNILFHLRRASFSQRHEAWHRRAAREAPTLGRWRGEKWLVLLAGREPEKQQSNATTIRSVTHRHRHRHRHTQEPA